MANLIETNDIVGLKVYGQQQVDYTVETGNGRRAGCDFALAVARASMLRSVAVESALNALSSIARLREQKITDLGLALSYIAAAAAHFSDKSETSDAYLSEGLLEARTKLAKYGISAQSYIVDATDPTTGKATGKVTKKNVGLLQTDVQYALDKEDNYLQQDLVSVQSYFSKRDQALSVAASLVKKVNNTMTSGIRAIN